MATVDASQLTVEELREYVRRGLDSLRKGEYFTEFGLSEDEIILEDGAKLPDKSDKRSSFFGFLNAVATEVVKKEQGGGKKKKKFIKEVVDRLQTFQDQWAALILGKGGDATAAAVDGGGGAAEESASMKREAKVGNGVGEHKATPKPSKKASKKRKLKEESIDSDNDEELLDDKPAVKKESIPSKVRDAASQARWLKRKAAFEKLRDDVLNDVPEQVKEKYGQIGFSKWGKVFIPVLIMNPFHVPPGPVRETWFDMYEKVKEANRLANMTNLVYWYGASTDLQNAYSFLVSSKVVSYKDGVKRGLDKLPKPMQKKIDAGDGKPLTSGIKQEVRALDEMKEDLEKEPHERAGHLPSFVDNYDESEDEDDSDSELLDDDPIDDPASPPKAKRQKKTKAKSNGGGTEEKTVAKPKSKAKSKKKSKPLEDENEPQPKSKEKSKKKKSEPVEDESEPEPQPKSKETLKKKKSKPVEDESEPEPQPKKKSKPKKKGTATPAIVDDMADIGDNELDVEVKAPEKAKDNEGLERPPPPVPNVEEIDEEPIPSDEDKDDEGYGESESELDNDDDADFDAVTSSNKNSKPKKKKTDAKEVPKKKVIKAKTKIDSKAIAKKKKAPGIKKLKEMEQAKFEELENKFLRIIQKWEQAIDAQDTPKLDMILSELLTKVEEFSAPFVEAYSIPNMVKKTKLVVGHNVETRKQLWGKMKELYAKKKESVPEGFLARKRSDASKAKKAATPVAPKNEEATPEAPLENTEAAGAEEGVKMEDSQESIPAPTSSLNSPIKRNGSLEKIVSSERQAEPKPAKSVTKPERKIFSLGSLGMGRIKPPSTEARIVSKSSTERASLSGQAAQKKVPTWISEATVKVTPADETRSFALEFLQQAAPFIPSNKHVNYDAIARALEEAIYDWARGLYKEAWVDKYWEKVHDLVASISGKDGAGTLATMISEGRYLSASEVVKLSEEALLCSFEGRPII